MYLAWFDDSKKSLLQKLREGAQAYQERFQVSATVVLVNPEAFQTLDVRMLQDISLVAIARASVRPHNFWFGVEG